MSRPLSHRYSHHHSHGHYSLALRYPRTIGARAWEFFILPALIVLCLFMLLRSVGNAPVSIETISPQALILAALNTLGRLFSAYILALVCAVPLALLATHSPLAQKFLLPLFDILQSVPILAFFPVVILLFLNLGLTNGAAIFILFLTMVWSITFAIIGGVGLIPRDIIYAAEVFGITGMSYIRRVIIPAIFPQAVVGSILALAQGWNIIIVAEVIRTYLPSDSPVQNLFGLGSMLVYASAHDDSVLFIAALGTSVFIIAMVNLFVWQKLLRYAAKFKFEQ